LLYLSNILLGFSTVRTFTSSTTRQQVLWHYSIPRHLSSHLAYLHFRPCSFSNFDTRFSLSPNRLWWFREIYPYDEIAAACKELAWGLLFLGDSRCDHFHHGKATRGIISSSVAPVLKAESCRFLFGGSLHGWRPKLHNLSAEVQFPRESYEPEWSWAGLGRHQCLLHLFPIWKTIRIKICSVHTNKKNSLVCIFWFEHIWHLGSWWSASYANWKN
jgi:hypothetical protein